MIIIRPARLTDGDVFYRISLETGDGGGDASPLYQDPNMLGHIYSAPYLQLSKDLSFVAELDGIVVGYVVGAADTRRFETLLEQEWWPDLRAHYRKPDPSKRDAWTADQRRADMIHNPVPTRDEIVSAFPAHMHLNMARQAQGFGIGSNLLQHWLDRASELGVSGVHIGANRQNHRAVGFWSKNGFEPLDGSTTGTVWMGRQV